MRLYTKHLVPRITTVLLGLAYLGYAAPLWAEPAKPETIRRFALIAGSNEGGPRRVPLRFAHSDAKAMARVLRQLGGVEAKDSIILIEPDRFDFEAGLSRMNNLLTEAGDASRSELIFYYSGHSDEQGLMLGDDLITYRELRESIAELDADVRIAILDSCSSGAMTRGKGGTRQAPFLIDTSVDVKGYAYLTSSSADEAAQESDRVGGSFFTHYLVSGLRGAADTSGDNKVTLNEAYHYAFNETLARTESTQGGPQHPNYDFQLRGSGDLVLTDLRGTSALLILPAEVDGRFFIRNHKGQLVAEINKASGQKVTFGLDPGMYEVTWERGDQIRVGSIALIDGSNTEIATNRLNAISKEATLARGEQPDEAPLSSVADDTLTHRPFRVAFVPGLSTDLRSPGKTINNFSLNFLGLGNYLRGIEGGFLGNMRTDTVYGAQGAGIFNLTRGDVRGVQGAGIFNFAGASLTGAQGAGIANIVHGPAKGGQFAGIANVNSKGSVQGGQGAGIVNFNRGGMTGIQGAGIANVNLGDFSKGFQGAGIVNANLQGSFKGLQGAGIANLTASGKGAQLAGIINVAYGDFKGFQAGLVNYAGRTTGVQLGLVNVSRENYGTPIGLVNAVGNGMLAPTIWLSDASVINIGVKMGVPHFYSILGYGVHPLTDAPTHGVIAGLGGHLDFAAVPLWLELDLINQAIRSGFAWSGDELDSLFKLRATLGFRLADELSLFAGPTLNALVSEERTSIGFLPNLWQETLDDQYSVALSLGFTVGVSWEPKLGKLNSRRTFQRSPEDGNFAP